MIEVINTKKESMTDFEKKYFSFTEAPEDQERTNVRKIRLKVSDGRKYDFRKGADEGDETPPEETANDTPTDDEEDAGDDVERDDDIDDQDTDDMDDDSEDDSGEDDAADEDDEVQTDGEAQSGDTGNDDDSTEDDLSNDNDEDNNNQDNPDNIRKQNLYRKFTNLYTAIDHYIHKLSTLIGIEEETNQKINAVTAKLKEIKEKLYDYMIICFTKASYEKSDIFYHRSVVAVSNLFDILEKIVEYIHSDDKDKKKNLTSSNKTKKHFVKS